ncbi:MAG TPA: hypothetical protein VNW99_12720 [Cytophagaceae bacterium]|nr:hypothetical protein [Cytophagaceae bacterium]
MFKKTFFALSVIASFAACKKKVDPVPATPLTGICYLISFNEWGILYFNDYYDSNNRLDSLVTIGSPNTAIKMKYNASGKLIKALGYSGSTNTLYHSFHYDANSRRDKDTLYINTGSFVADSVISYTYNVSGQITKADGIGISSGNTGYIVYTYDADGNMIHEQRYYGTTLVATTNYTYDTKNYSSLFGSSDLISSIQKHNILTQVVKDGTGTIDIHGSYTATYTYNSNNYPITEIDNYQDGTSQTSPYTYACK